MCKFVNTILLLLALCCFCCFPGYAQDYLMSETERIECLKLINDLEQTLQQQKTLLNSLETTNAELLQKLTDTERKLTDLKALLETNQILLADLQAELQRLKKDLADCEKLLKDYQKQIFRLKFQRWLWLVFGIGIGKLLL